MGDSGSIPRLGRSRGGENSNPPQYSCLENPMDREGRATDHGVTKRVRHDLVTKTTTTNISPTQNLNVGFYKGG